MYERLQAQSSRTFVREWNHAKSREVTRGNGGEMTTSHRWIYGWITFFNQIIAETGSETSHT